MKPSGPTQLVIFDMDGTLLQEITIFILGKKLGFDKQLREMIGQQMTSLDRNTRIALLLKGKSEQELLKIFRNIPLHNHVEEVISGLKQQNIKTALVTNSYLFFAKDLQQRLHLDYVYANNLIIENGIVTGEYTPSNGLLQERFKGCKIHPICKSSIVDELCQKLNVSTEEIIAVGDGSIDICMLEKAGVGVAFNASAEVCKHADVCIDDLRSLLDIIM